MKNIVLTRIDDRLIHGQVMTSWLVNTGANKIMVVDDLVAEDEFMKSVLKSCVPQGVQLAVYNTDGAVERLQKGFAEGDRLIILVKYPKTLYDIINKGIPLDAINIGGMAVNAGRKKLYKNIAASDEERRQLADLIAKGVKIEIQITAQDPAVDVAKLL